MRGCPGRCSGSQASWEKLLLGQMPRACGKSEALIGHQQEPRRGPQEAVWLGPVTLWAGLLWAGLGSAWEEPCAPRGGGCVWREAQSREQFVAERSCWGWGARWGDAGGGGLGASEPELGLKGVGGPEQERDSDQKAPRR